MANRGKVWKWLEEQQGRIRSWIFQITHRLNSAEIDDVVQQVSLELLSYDEEIEKPEALAKTITIGRVYNALNRRTRAPLSLEDFDPEVGPSNYSIGDADAAPATRSSAREQCLDIWIAIGKLEDPQRTILCQRWAEQMTFADIAARQKMPESTVRCYYEEAVERLGRILRYVTLSGIVEDELTNRINSVEIVARGVRLQGYRKTTTDRHGQFAMIFLQPGQYSLLIRKPGYMPNQCHLDLAKDTHLPSIVLCQVRHTEEVKEDKAAL
jgi:RNA polymerase sigma factor (sigma-70 family)